jgi:hypothetical protein
MAGLAFLNMAVPVVSDFVKGLTPADTNNLSMIDQGLKTVGDALGFTADKVIPIMQQVAGKMTGSEFDKAFGKYGLSASMFGQAENVAAPAYVGNSDVGYSEPVYSEVVNPVTGEKKKVITGYKKIANTSKAEQIVLDNVTKQNSGDAEYQKGLSIYKNMPPATKTTLIRNAKKAVVSMAKAQGRTLEDYEITELAIKYVVRSLAAQS